MTNIIYTIAKNILQERLRQHLTQADLAEKADMHNNYIGLIERGKCNISVVSLEKLAKALNIKMGKLIGEEK